MKTRNNGRQKELLCSVNQSQLFYLWVLNCVFVVTTVKQNALFQLIAILVFDSIMF